MTHPNPWPASSKPFPLSITLLLIGLLLISYTLPRKAFAETIQPLVMGFVPSRSVHAIQLSSKEIAQYLSQEIGVPIKAITLSNYAGVAVGMKTKRVDFAFVGPLNYLAINSRVPVIPLTAAVRHGSKSYRGLIIAREDSGINSLNDLKGKDMALADELSASGSLYPKDAMISAGIDPKKDITSLHLSSQSAIVMSVYSGKVSAGAIYDDARTNPEVMQAKPDVLTKTKVIYRTPEIPSDLQIARADLDPVLISRLKQALLKLGKDETAKQWLKSTYSIDTLEDTSPEDYKGLQDVINRVNPDLIKEVI